MDYAPEKHLKDFHSMSGISDSDKSKAYFTILDGRHVTPSEYHLKGHVKVIRSPYYGRQQVDSCDIVHFET